MMFFAAGVRSTDLLHVTFQLGPDSALGCALLTQIEYGVTRIKITESRRLSKTVNQPERQ